MFIALTLTLWCLGEKLLPTKKDSESLGMQAFIFLISLFMAFLTDIAFINFLTKVTL